MYKQSEGCMTTLKQILNLSKRTSNSLYNATQMCGFRRAINNN